MKRPPFDTKKMILLALLTAIVVVLQILAMLFPVYPFRLALVLVPIVIGAAMCGPLAGMWLGIVFGFVVLFTSPDVPFFMSFNAIATVAVIISRGALSGLFTGLVYKLIEKKGKTIAVIVAALTCPILNTGIFLLGLHLFFRDVIGDVIAFFYAFVALNLLIELAINIVLSPTIIRLIEYNASASHSHDKKEAA